MTKNPRITVTLQPSVHAVLRQLALLADTSQSALVGELLEQSMPDFERMVKVLEAAKAAKSTLHAEMVSGLELAQAKLERQMGLALETMDEGFRPLLSAAESVQRRAVRAGDARAARAPARASRRPPTPMSNRGVTPSTRKTGKKAKGA
jgi:polyhydroxyalkanoate synthesis regulator protein